ncbi:hypothetical protein NP284_35925 [Rhodopseudomonas pseudopalustris]|uniref:hypothetical protein n=1 Tax=Rhodopseudomonas pseudopalustris TaxID=1513892 RepID=UPI003F969383
MIPLRDHLMRLCGVAEELTMRGGSEDWRAVSESLHLAAALKDLSADTDVNGDSLMCGTAADFDAAHSEVAAKYLAGVVVFNLVWGAYEWAVEIASRPLALKQPRGARGRDLICHVFGDKHFPHLRGAVLDALDLSSKRVLDLGSREMRRMLVAGSLAGIGAEYLRGFRNALAHGTLEKPMPEDWGEGSDYKADDDPALRQFQVNTRLTLLLMQILMRFASAGSEELTASFDEPQSAALVLTQLHCPFETSEGAALPLGDAPLVQWRDHHFYRQVSLGKISLDSKY